MNDKLPGNAAVGISVDKNSGSKISTVLLWITFAVVALATVFLYMQSRSVQNAVLDKEATRDEVVAQLSTPSYIQIEEKANGFKEAYNILTQISGTQVPKKELLTELYKYFTKDVFIRNLALSADGSLVVDGDTGSYRAVADFMTALKSYERISNITLGSVSVANGEGVASNKSVSFTVNCKLDTAQKAAVAEETPIETDISDSDSTDTTDTTEVSGQEDSYEVEEESSDDELDPMDTYN